MSKFALSESLLEEMAMGKRCPFPRYLGELPCGSAVLVCYTLSTWFNANPSGGGEGRYELSCNLIFVVLFAIYDVDKIASRIGC